MTTNIDLIKIAKNNNIKLDYIIFKDEIFKIPYKSGTNIIVNMASTGHTGTHWVALRLYGSYIFYFDSYGIPPPEEIIEYAKQNKKNTVVYNDYQVEYLDGTNCGQLSLLFLRLL